MLDLYQSCEDLESYITLTESEREWFLRRDREILSPECRIPRYYLDLIHPDDHSDPIRRQCVPTSLEYEVSCYEMNDPLGEIKHSPESRLLHRYEDRALFLATDECMMYCRHCFRRRFTSRGHQGSSAEEIRTASRYIKNHPQIRELLISGGDPLMLPDSRIDEMLGMFRAGNPSLVFRICTRMPVVFPQRITSSLIAVLEKYKPLYLATQYNHPRECTSESMKAISSCIRRGITVLNQTVLLRGVNDSAAVLKELFTTLVKHQVIPYYLFQGDMAEGTSHMRVPLRRGMEIARELGKEISGLAMPKYAVDLPGGGGKILLLEQTPEIQEIDRWGYTSDDNALYWYPLED